MSASDSLKFTKPVWKKKLAQRIYNFDINQDGLLSAPDYLGEGLNLFELQRVKHKFRFSFDYFFTKQNYYELSRFSLIHHGNHKYRFVHSANWVNREELVLVSTKTNAGNTGCKRTVNFK